MALGGQYPSSGVLKTGISRTQHENSNFLFTFTVGGSRSENKKSGEKIKNKQKSVLYDYKRKVKKIKRKDRKHHDHTIRLLCKFKIIRVLFFFSGSVQALFE